MATVEPSAYNPQVVEQAHRCQETIDKILKIHLDEYEHQIRNIASGEHATKLEKDFKGMQNCKEQLLKTSLAFQALIANQEELNRINQQHQVA